MALRNRLAVSGGLGIVAGAALTGGAVFLLQRGALLPLLSGTWTWLLLAFLFCFSVAEIPVMILAMRQIAKSISTTGLITLINFIFAFFAAVYVLPFLLLTGRIGIGVGLASLGLVRVLAAVLFIPAAQSSRLVSRSSASNNL
jgi:hypothetical protein